MRKVLGLVLLTLCLSGCAGETMTKWECVGRCIPREQAYNRCMTEASTGPASRSISIKTSIWEQCMRGEGFREVRCTEADKKDPRADCRVSHEF